ncbi:hypothetical protein [Jannaschia seosinensis]|uniref:hypothetical protein n=1 Tax=Jannaschia seosinensis TaxID=313367 RepID=UPI001C90266E|nr:hypothetical protein [Jannaschia seosinensis]
MLPFNHLIVGARIWVQPDVMWCIVSGSLGGQDEGNAFMAATGVKIPQNFKKNGKRMARHARRGLFW